MRTDPRVSDYPACKRVPTYIQISALYIYKDNTVCSLYLDERWSALWPQIMSKSATLQLSRSKTLTLKP
jgi:hypothetical protein